MFTLTPHLHLGLFNEKAIIFFERYLLFPDSVLLEYKLWLAEERRGKEGRTEESMVLAYFLGHLMDN